jgi:hypothetical protein
MTEHEQRGSADEAGAAEFDVVVAGGYSGFVLGARA